MTNEEMLKVLEDLKYQFDDRIAESEYSKDKDLLEALQSNKMASKALDMAIKALEQEPCEDCISRQAVLDLATTIKTDDYSGNEILEVVEVEDIKMLSPVTPKEKTGWIPVSERLPEEFQRVLVTIVNYKGDKIVRVAEYYSWNNGKRMIFQIKENREEWEVGEKGLLAWMPLPESYKVESEE